LSINRAIAVHLTKAVGTMWCVYAFTVLSLFPIAVPASTGAIQYISSGVLQLVLLPALMVGSAILNEGAEDRARQDHEILIQELQMLRDILDALNLATQGHTEEK